MGCNLPAAWLTRFCESGRRDLNSRPPAPKVLSHDRADAESRPHGWSSSWPFAVLATAARIGADCGGLWGVLALDRGLVPKPTAFMHPRCRRFVSWYTNRRIRDIASEVAAFAADRQGGFAVQSTPRLTGSRSSHRKGGHREQVRTQVREHEVPSIRKGDQPPRLPHLSPSDRALP